MKSTRKVCISLTEKQYEQIQLLANESFRTRAGYIRKIITNYLNYIESNPEKKIN